MLRGGASTTAALESLSTDLRALQAQVARLEQAVIAVDRRTTELDRRLLEDVDRLRLAAAEVTDDLVERVDAVRAEVRSLQLGGGVGS
jgi:hypothetical protein